MPTVAGYEGSELQMMGKLDQNLLNLLTGEAMGSLYKQFGAIANEEIPQAIMEYTRNMGSFQKSKEALDVRALYEKDVLRPMNHFAARRRNVIKSVQDPNWVAEDAESAALFGMSKSALRKAVLDVGTLTNFANIVGGQSLGYVSLDTRMARSTIRPNSFTLWQSLDKSLAWQVVDYWAIASATGGAAPGSAFANYTSVSSGTLTTSAGTYQLQNILLKLMLDGRAITTALAAQNNYVNVSEQENMNAALTVLQTVNWSAYKGDTTFFANQFNGIEATIRLAGTGNVFDFQKYATQYESANTWSNEVTLYNLIYQAAAQITSYGTFGHVTHAFMTPAAMGSFQYLTATQLNNVVTQITALQDRAPIVVNGNVVGMQTRTGHIQFPQDLMIEAREKCLQALYPTQISLASPTQPTTVTAVVNAPTVVASEFTGSYAGTSALYQYAVSACDASMNESAVRWTSGATSAVSANGSVTLTITPADTNQVAFRVFRAGQGYNVASSPDVNKIRYIGAVMSNGTNPVTFVDLNGGYNPLLTTQTPTKIPGSAEIYLLDMDPVDMAIDFRLLLPLVRVELFASNLFMPWAVAMIAALRMRVPQFHGYIKNYVPTNPVFDPLATNLP